MSEAITTRDKYRLEEWRQVVLACRESGLSNREFCRLNGISEKTYYYRLRKLREEAVHKELANDNDHFGAGHNTTLCRIDIENKEACVEEHSNIRVHFHDADIYVPQDVSPDTLKMVLCVLSGI